MNRSNVDWLGLALELESQAKRATSQSMQRAMEAGARGLRLMGGETASPAPYIPATVREDACLRDRVVAMTRSQFRHQYQVACRQGGEGCTEEDIESSWAAYQRDPAGHFLSKG